MNELKEIKAIKIWVTPKGNVFTGYVGGDPVDEISNEKAIGYIEKIFKSEVTKACMDMLWGFGRWYDEQMGKPTEMINAIETYLEQFKAQMEGK